MLLISLCSCNGTSITQNDEKVVEEGFVENVEDLNGKKIAVIAGSIQENLALSQFPDSEFMYYNDFTQCLLEVGSGRADFTIVTEVQYEALKDNYPDLVALYPSISKGSVHFGAPKNEESRKYLDEINQYIAYLRKTGKLAEYEMIASNSKYECPAYDFSTLTGTNGTLKYMCTIMDRPFLYLTENKYAGIEADILYGFCETYGYQVDIMLFDEAGFLAGLSSEKYNLASTLVYTDERAEIIDFSDLYYEVGQVAVCRMSSLVNEPMYRDYDALDGQTIAASTGTLQDELSHELLPNSTIDGYANFTDGLIAVSEGKAEAICVPETQIVPMLDVYDNLTMQEKPVHSSSLYFGFSKSTKGAKIQSQLNEYLNKSKADGSLQTIWNYWLNLSEGAERKVFDFSKTSDTNGTIVVRFEPLNLPMIHQYKEGFSGYEAEILYNFALEYGYRLDVQIIDWASVLAGVTSGKYDLLGYCYYTDERAESILYSTDYLEQTSYFVTRKSDKSINASKQSFWEKVQKSFEKNFIREDRWKMMLDGLWVTIKITLFTALFGTIFGIILCCIRRGKNKVASAIVKVFVRILQGIPIVVLLLVMYYIIFAQSKISGITVGVIGFSIDFGVYVSEILRSGIEAVDKGQWESAYALGFDKFRTYTKVIIPQALQHALPVYKGQFISMVKMTSVVGYVAVQDLTKASDIIRSRTYDAFMPIIATAIVYFILAWILTSLMSLIEFKNDPTKRKNILSDIDATKLNLNTVNAVKSQVASKIENGEEIIRIEHLKKEYENVTPLEDVNAVVYKGDIISIIGPSGTGKSTFIRMLNRLEEPTSGNIYAFDNVVGNNHKELCALREKMGMVFQSYNLFNHLTIIENIMLAPVVIKGISRQDAYEQGMKLLKRVGLVEKALNYPSELSGGQKQRVAIVRALAMDPEVMLLDEPTSALDPGMINEVLHVIEDLAETGMTMLIVTHEMKFARSVSNRVFYMDEGSIYEEGSTDQIFSNPQKEKTKAFIYHLQLFNFVIESPDFDFINLRTSLDTFAYQQIMKGRIQNKLMLCVEELVTQGLVLLNKEAYPAKIIMEYGEDNVLNANLTYKGDKYDFTENMDEISSRIIRAQTDELEYLYTNNVNEIHFTIK